MTAKLLDVSSLTIAFPRGTPVADFGFAIGEGETVAVVGESGSGKSLTALAIMRLLPRTARIASGSIGFRGRDLLALPEPDMRKVRGREIAMIFQEPMTSLNPVLTVGKQIAEVLRLHEGLSAEAARKRSIELLDLVRVADPHLRVDDFPHRLSGGMRQRVMIAMAVACRPKLLIADEPTTALDVTIQAQVLDLLDRLRRELGMALMLITHDLGIVGQWADRVVVLYAGRGAEEADAGPLLEDPLHPYTKGLLAASPRLDARLHYTAGALREIPGSIATAQREPGCPFVPRCAMALPSCRISPPPLEEIRPRRLLACPPTAAQEQANASAVGR
ncbi:MAG: ABC transporter ATP-binding protein [Alphaproteobacteria bacterium]|nr:ABC transporter ATP-binding protein [Alphaproteobacteria bacterium]